MHSSFSAVFLSVQRFTSHMTLVCLLLCNPVYSEKERKNTINSRLCFEFKDHTPLEYMRKAQAGNVTQNINPSLKQGTLIHVLYMQIFMPERSFIRYSCILFEFRGFLCYGIIKLHMHIFRAYFERSQDMENRTAIHVLRWR